MSQCFIHNRTHFTILCTK